MGQFWVQFNSIGYFIFEGVNRSNVICETYASFCYLRISIIKKGSSLPSATKRIYIDIQDADYYYEHLWAGAGANGRADVMPGQIFPITAKHKTTKNLLAGIYTPKDIKRDRVLMTHGWRMTDNEKKQFADTTLKRLYWSGYVGQFTFLTWPTGWFDKPAHLYRTSEYISYVVQGMNEQNYDYSEVAARKTGVELSEYLANEKVNSQANYEQLHIIAHSMGNVVVSEALSHANTRWKANSYTASQAAEAAGAYDSLQGLINHKWVGVGVETGPEAAWRYYNSDTLLNNGFDMPADRHRFTIPIEHGPTYDDAYALLQLGMANDENQSLYKRMQGSVERMINFYNPDDAALKAWEFNGLTRPDACARDKVDCYDNYPSFTLRLDDTDNPAIKRDRFYRGSQELDWVNANGEVSNPITEHEAWVLGMITPPRTQALGQVEMDERGHLSYNFLVDYGKSNQGHSGQFYSAYSDALVKDYWRRILDVSLDRSLLDSKVSGLRTYESLEQ